MGNKLFSTFLFILFTSVNIFSQVVITDPFFPTVTDDVTIIFDASQGNGALEDYAGTIYAHTGVITDASISLSDWKHVQGTWGTADPEVEMTALGDNKYSITYNITDFYGISGTEIVYQMSFVFRNADGSIVGREADGSDIYTGVYEAGLNVAILFPSSDFYIVEEGSEIYVEGVSTYSDLLELYVDDVLEAYTPDSTITFPITATGSGTHTIVLKASDDVSSVSDTTTYFILPDITVADLPAGVHQGINYMDDNTVTLVLFAPYKDYVFAIGDFSNWELQDDFFMNITPDGKTYWKTITGLTAAQEYAFQYLIDGNLKVADPLCEKILDPDDDAYISEATYPGLMDYPVGKTTGNVSVLQTAQPEYNWVVDDFIPPANGDLIIYELLVRDFSEARNYQTLIDTLNYLITLGVNAIELMPVNEFEGNESWGYNPSFFTALDKYYGTKNKFKEFIDTCHANGIAVIMDIAMNHAFGQSPLAQMWWDAVANTPSAENPYLNQIPKHDYNVGYDFNHESDATKKMRTLTFRYWFQEYNIDGYRFDLSKGYTQNNTLGDVGAWGMYDASRINIWQDIEDSIRLIKDNAILILEHFAENSEEKELSNRGFLLWGNMSYNYNQATMGYSGSDLNWASYKSRGWEDPHAVVYMESHDEERLMYKNLTYGNTTNPDHNAKELNTALLRMEAAAAFHVAIPGPKMIWQFGEVGYDYSIDYGCRVCNKPVRWDYLDNPNRYHLYQTYSALNHLKKNYPAFGTDDFTMNVGGSVKAVNLNDDDMNVTVLGNFQVTSGTIDPNFQHTGKWYDYFSGDSINVSDTHASFTLEPGSFRVYTDVSLAVPDIDTIVEYLDPEIIIQNISIYPNPSSEIFNIQFESLTNEPIEMEIINAVGEIIYTEKIETFTGSSTITWNAINNAGNKVEKGIYFCILKSKENYTSIKLIIQ
ncbi:MAG: T9SS type A sorting domain-containing protein [Fimbriimonadaceae bacterium]|nr:T9SS type A sorting domain-containing protein [Chitinophagales bacterium]